MGKFCLNMSYLWWLFVWLLAIIQIVQGNRIGSSDKRNKKTTEFIDSLEHLDDLSFVNEDHEGLGKITHLDHPDLDILSSIGIEHHPFGHETCEPIKIGLCTSVLGYNQTSTTPNHGHDGQGDVEAYLHTFAPLIQYGCSEHLKLFLCSAYLPMCTEKVPEAIGPCRSLCESVKNKCEPVLIEFGFKWPESLECSLFKPQNDFKHMCIPGPSDPDFSNSNWNSQKGSFDSNSYFGQTQQHTPIFHNNNNHPPPPPPVIPSDIFSPHSPHQSPASAILHNLHNLKNAAVNNNNNPPFINGINHLPNNLSSIPSNSEHSEIAKCSSNRKIWTKDTCWIKCEGGSGGLFTQNEKNSARKYSMTFSIIAICGSFFTIVISFCVSDRMTIYRPILYMTLCQLMLGIGLLIGSSVDLSSIACFQDKTTGIFLLAKGGQSVPSSCAIVFLLNYFFGMACILWWVMLCLSYLLSQNLSFSTSLLNQESSIFHLVTWGLSSIFTSAALVFKNVDADELTGICGVGYQDAVALKWYIFIPLSTFFTLGVIFLITGFIQSHFPNSPIFKIWQCLPQSQTKVPIKQNPHPPPSILPPSVSSRRSEPEYAPILALPPPSNSTYCLCHNHYGNCINCHLPPPPPPTTATSTARYVVRNSPNSVIGISVNSSSYGGGGGGIIKKIGTLDNSSFAKEIWKRVAYLASIHVLTIGSQIGFIIYELMKREEWEEENRKSRPNFDVLILRLIMNLMIGITTTIWISMNCSCRSLKIIKFFSKIFQSRQSPSFCRSQDSNSTSISNRSSSNMRSFSRSVVTESAIRASTVVPLLPQVPPPLNNPTNLSSFRPPPPVAFRGGMKPPMCPKVPNSTLKTSTEIRTDAWRRGETIV